jgi:superfamily I DNA/RNA helicase
MINKYPGNCECGARVEAGAGEAYRPAPGARWAVRCATCRAGGVVVTERPAPQRPAEPETYTLLSGHEASPYQAAVFDHFRYGHGSRIIKAVAGAGKTTTIKNAVRHLYPRLSVQLIAFNVEATDQLKAAIAELEERDGRPFKNVRANSYNSLGMRAVLRYLNLPREQIRVESDKCRRLLKERLGETPEAAETLRMYSAFACRLVGLAKGEGIGCLRPDVESDWYSLVDHHGLYLDSREATVEMGIEIARRLLGWSCEAAREGWLDFDDQLYLVILWKLRLWQNDVVIVDEAQDTNPVQRALLHLVLKNGGRLYAVGDDKQAIYGFRGASTDAMAAIAREFSAQPLPLTVSYRCSRAVVERAKTWMPDIESHDAAPEGEVMDDAPLHAALNLVGPQDAILCRQTAPLVSVAYGLLARGRACRILGREIGEGLVNLIEQQRARGIDRLIEKLEEWRDREMARFTAKGQEQRAEAVADRVDCILVIAEALPETERTVPALVRRIQGMFEDAKKGEVQSVLTLATIHKAKGKEWDNVLVLRPDLMPSRAARQEWQQEEENNLMGVAATRAKLNLIYSAYNDMTIEPPRAT